MKYIGYLETEAGETSRFLRKVTEDDDPLIVFKTIWKTVNKEGKIGYVYAEMESNIFQVIAVMVPIRYTEKVEKNE